MTEVEKVLAELEERITLAQHDVIRTVGRDVGNRMAGLEQAVMIINQLRNEQKS